MKTALQTVPMSLRTRDMEEYYAAMKQAGRLEPLSAAPSLVEFRHWRIINNEFPPNVAYEIAHMLLPKRKVATFSMLKDYERQELREIIDTHCQLHYDQVTENMMLRRSVPDHYHLHLLKFYNSREQMSL